MNGAGILRGFNADMSIELELETIRPNVVVGKGIELKIIHALPNRLVLRCEGAEETLHRYRWGTYFGIKENMHEPA